jgi:hypothetical protein
VADGSSAKAIQAQLTNAVRKSGLPDSDVVAALTALAASFS